MVRPWTRLINWGNGRAPVGTGPFDRVSNSFAAVAAASNKLSTFRLLENKDGIRIPVFTTDRSVAAGWIRDGVVVVCRTQLNGHSGAGILLSGNETDLVDAPLYVQYVKKQQEFRVHVAFGEVIDVQEKRRTKRDSDGDGEGVPTNYQIRNHHTGWVYCRENITEPGGLREMAIRTVQEVGLDFGAVDLIYNAKRNEVYVLEVNCAPGLEGTTVTKYVDAFKKALV